MFTTNIYLCDFKKADILKKTLVIPKLKMMIQDTVGEQSVGRFYFQIQVNSFKFVCFTCHNIHIIWLKL